MYKNYQYSRLWWGLLLALVVSLAGLEPAKAQQLTYGNEWIVPGQQYFKLKLYRTGLYKIDYQYLTAAGITGVAPQNLQLWRRGQELSRYVGGNAQTLDASTYIEFYGQRNDGKLDKDFYKAPTDQPQPLYSYYTDTASYFITWSVGASTRPGRDMVQPAAVTGVPQAYRLLNTATLKTYGYTEGQYSENLNFQPWFDKGEGYLSGYIGVVTPANGTGYNNAAAWATDSVMVDVPQNAGPLRVEVYLAGSSNTNINTIPYHRTEIAVIPPGAPARVLDTIQYRNYNNVKRTFPLLRSDLAANGKVTIRFRVYDPSLSVAVFDRFRLANYRVIVPQNNHWYANKRHLLFQNDSLLGGPASYEIDSIPAAVHGYDVTDPYNVQRITGTTGGTATSRVFVFPSADRNHTRWLLLAGDRPYTPQPAQRVTFRTLSPTQPNFVIVTGRALLGAAGSVPNAAQAYADYRSSAAGGGHNVLLVTSEELYDQFHYGEKSALALRRFALWIADNAGGQAKHMLLLGNGVYYVGPVVPINAADGEKYTFRDIPAARTYARDLVPVSGRSTSDAFFTADWPHNSYVPRLITGRVPANTPQEVVNYLEKLRTHEALGMEPWRKNVLNLVAGENTQEADGFNSYMTYFRTHYIERPLWGGHVVNTIVRASTLPSSAKIDRELNAGLSLINYFGHGSNTTFGLDISTPDIATNNYNNSGRYPIMMFNGCAGTFTSAAVNSDKPLERTFAERWLLTADRGAIGMLGQSGLGYPTELNTAQDSVFSLLLTNPNWYGKPIPVVYAEAVRRLQTANQGPIWAEQLMGTMWLGDPKITLFAPERPDFQTSSGALSIAPSAGQTIVSASSKTFVLNIGVQNPGKITHDTLEIRVLRSFTGGVAARDTTFKFRQSWHRDTIYTATLHNPTGVNVFGTNTFRVELDPRNRIQELDETNNSGTLLFTLLKAGVTVLSPPEFAIVSNNHPLLVAQNNNPQGTLRGYSFEVDTTARFNSAFRKDTTVMATLTPRWQPRLRAIASRDSVVWYWRVRFQTATGDEDSSWTVSSFRVIQGNPGGWSQSHYAQLQRDELQNVAIAAPTGRWRFIDERKPMTLRTRGGGAPRSPANFWAGVGYGIIADASNPPIVANCATLSPNLLVAVYDQHTLRLKQVASTGYLTCGQAPQPFYMFANDPTTAADTLDNVNNSATRRGELQSLLSTVPNGDYVALLSMNRVRWADPALAGMRATLTTLLGSALINQLHNGDPLALLARKNSTGGQLVRELGPNLAAGSAPRADQEITLNDTLSTPSFRGKITSVRIGPAQEWQTLYHWVKQESTTSSYQLRIVGIDTLGNHTVLNSNVGTSRLALGASISARTYPYLQLEMELQDSVNRAAPQLKEWFITYRGVPEGVVRRDLVAASAYSADTLAQQAATKGVLHFPVRFENVTAIDFGTPMQTKVEVRDASGVLRKSVTIATPRQLKGDSTLTIDVKVPVVGLFGAFTTKVTVNPQPRALPELYYFNNELTLPAFTVADNNLPPTLDVAFDGRRIMSGELVSPSPIITIQMNDEDRLRHISNPNYFTVTLQRPGQPAAAVDLSAANTSVRFTADSTKGSVARLEFQPGQRTPLADGIYTLRVQGHDPSTAIAGISPSGDAQDYEVKFEVVNASTITNIFPYPNPVTSKAKFVFTVTGQELPRNMKIQIMTIAGRVVREIFMSELGPLHIGNNITDYAWDGTDEYGDRLANGTYLYRVSLDDPGSQFSQRKTAADRAFKNDWGKLVLMR